MSLLQRLSFNQMTAEIGERMPHETFAARQTTC